MDRAIGSPARSETMVTMETVVTRDQIETIATTVDKSHKPFSFC
jgi:hypothetical protein